LAVKTIPFLDGTDVDYGKENNAKEVLTIIGGT
jgi:hypothetical protein